MRRVIVLVTIFTFAATAAPTWAQDDRAAGPVPPGEHSPHPRSTPESFTKLVEHPDTLEIINVSDRPIFAWMVRTETRSSQGYVARTQTGVDAFRDELLPTGTTHSVLLPGASAMIKRPKPWLREDHRGPGSSVRHYVGLVVFEDDQAFGDADLIERLFERRRSMAREAAEALEALEGDPTKLHSLPMYRDVFNYLPDQDEALAEIRRRAREDYQLTLDHLRPQDLAVLARELERAHRSEGSKQ